MNQTPHHRLPARPTALGRARALPRRASPARSRLWRVVFRPRPRAAPPPRCPGAGSRPRRTHAPPTPGRSATSPPTSSTSAAPPAPAATTTRSPRIAITRWVGRSSPSPRSIPAPPEDRAHRQPVRRPWLAVPRRAGRGLRFDTGGRRSTRPAGPFTISPSMPPTPSASGRPRPLVPGGARGRLRRPDADQLVHRRNRPGTCRRGSPRPWRRAGRSGPTACSATPTTPSRSRGRVNRYQEPVFDGLAIGCERCHGPGREARRRPPPQEPVAGDVDPTIVNPAHLDPPLREAVCEQCHLAGEARVLRRGRRSTTSARAAPGRLPDGVRPRRRGGTRQQGGQPRRADARQPLLPRKRRRQKARLRLVSRPSRPRGRAGRARGPLPRAAASPATGSRAAPAARGAGEDQPAGQLHRLPHAAAVPGQHPAHRRDRPPHHPPPPHRRRARRPAPRRPRAAGGAVPPPPAPGRPGDERDLGVALLGPLCGRARSTPCSYSAAALRLSSRPWPATPRTGTPGRPRRTRCKPRGAAARRWPP